nr:TolC family protein [Polymorphobacter fuscus]
MGERGADVAAAAALRDQARSRLFPTLGVDAVGARTIARDFQLSSTQVENLSPRSRNDVTGSVEQLVADFGATGARIRAGNANEDSARATLDAARNAALLQLVGAWVDVLSARTAVSLSAATVARLDDLAQGAALRFERGVDSGGDVARARSYLAAAQSQQVNFLRRRTSAEARFAEIFGSVPGTLVRPALPGDAGIVTPRPEVVAARADARAADAAVDAAKSDRLPRIGIRVGGTAYDVLNGRQPDHDVRAQLTLTQRFSAGGGEAARVAELAARRQSAGFAVDRIDAAATRERATAEADVAGLAGSLPPLTAAYLDALRARDLFVEQFRVSRGTLFDVLRAERDLLDTALALAQTGYDHDVARFTLLARRGGLIEYFGLTPAVIANRDLPQ